MDQNEKENSSTVITVQNSGASQSNNETPEALLTDVILENIFKYLSFNDLMACRDVENVIWLRSSKKAWWSKTKVAIFDHRGDSNLMEFLNEPEINLNAINYKLSNFITGEYKGLWENFGHKMKHLELHCCYLSTVDALQQLIYIQCPNLQKLSLEIIAFIKKPNAKVVEPMKWKEPKFGEQKNLKFLSISFTPTSFGYISLMEVLSHFPNLQALECCVNVDIYKIISIIREHDPSKLNLNHIDVRVKNVNVREDSLSCYSVQMYDEECIESSRLVLLDPKLSLETVTMRIESDQSETLVDILEAHAESLKHFTLLNRNKVAIRLVPRKTLDMLEEIKIVCNLSPVYIFKRAPNLKTISLDLAGPKNLAEKADGNFRIETCKELKIAFGQKGHEMPDSGFAILVDAFPNVEKLEIDGLSYSKLSMICERWTKLVSLKVSFADRETINRTSFQSGPRYQSSAGGILGGLFRQRATSTRSERAAKFDFVLTELEKLPNLKTFKWKYFQFGEKHLWKKLCDKYPQE